MGRPCTICSHPQRKAINLALAAGYSYRDAAGYYAVPRTALHRHWQAHMAGEGERDVPALRRELAVVGLGIADMLWMRGRAFETFTVEMYLAK